MDEIAKLMEAHSDQLRRILDSFLLQIDLDAIVRSFDEDIRKWNELTSYGWYFHWQTEIGTVSKLELPEDKDLFDSYMQRDLEENWDGITAKIISLYPERKHVLEVAFKLHEEGNYVACIPLFLSQTDGIVAQNLRTFLFSEHERRQKKIQDAIENSNSIATTSFLEILNKRTQFGASISSSSETKKERAPNRNGILHGSRKHLDYPTKLNSFKSFSLLAFVVLCFDKEIKEDS